MKIQLAEAQLKGKINSIPSKSYAHRISICNFLAGKEPTAGCKDFTSKDITVTENCLKTLLSGGKVLDCGESGSTLRFMLPLTSALGGSYEFIGHGKLIDRPNDELFSVMEQHGVKARKTDRIFTDGKLTSGEYKIRGDISSQYISGLLMALPILEGDSKIILTTPLVSAPYVDITLQVLKSFGVEIEKQESGYFIKGNQKYSGTISPEGDWSNMAFFLVAGAINGEVTVKGLNIYSVQGDKAILDILKKAGADLSISKDEVTVKKSGLNAFSFNAEDCPDLVPIASVLASYANGITIIKNIQRLKIKESDRIYKTIEMLKAFGIKAESDGKELTIYGNKPTNGKINSFNDHRIVMSASVLALGTKGVSEISDYKAVEKSYPTFFLDYNSLGGKAVEL